MTTLRVLLVPVVVLLILSRERGSAYIAAAVFFVGAATDRLDGYIARRTSSETAFGKIMDPIADKLFVIAPVIALVSVERFPVWAAVVIIAREVGVSVLRAWLAGRGRSMPVSRLGKWKTAGQLVAILLYVLPLDGLVSDVRFGVLLVALGLTVWSGVDYALRSMRKAAA